jgi:hypothetical protein
MVVDADCPIVIEDRPTETDVSIDSAVPPIIDENGVDMMHLPGVPTEPS